MAGKWKARRCDQVLFDDGLTITAPRPVCTPTEIRAGGYPYLIPRRISVR